jgi:hypothetical protein
MFPPALLVTHLLLGWYIMVWLVCLLVQSRCQRINLIGLPLGQFAEIPQTQSCLVVFVLWLGDCRGLAQVVGDMLLLHGRRKHY